MRPADALIHWPAQVWSALDDPQRDLAPLMRASRGTFCVSCDQADVLLRWLIAEAESSDASMATRVACGIAIYRVREALRIAAM
jgi:hypothetical protein